jgi:hypothetical protein
MANVFHVDRRFFDAVDDAPIPNALRINAFQIAFQRFAHPQARRDFEQGVFDARLQRWMKAGRVTLIADCYDILQV